VVLGFLLPGIFIRLRPLVPFLFSLIDDLKVWAVAALCVFLSASGFVSSKLTAFGIYLTKICLI
jgi:hypothetical protein